MAFSDLCHINNAYKTVENDVDQSERIMEENSMVRDLITKILDESGPTEGSSSLQPPEKTLNGMPNYPTKSDLGNTSYPPPSYFQDNLYNFNQNDPNGLNFGQNGFTNGFVNYQDNELLNLDPVEPSTDVTPEQLNLLRLAAQEIGGAQFTSPNNEKFFNFFESNQRNSLPETNMFGNNFRPNSLNLDVNYPNYDNFNQMRFNKPETNQDSNELLSYLNNMNLIDRREEPIPNNLDFKMPMEMNGHYQDDFKMQEDRNKVFFPRNFQQPPPNYKGENFFHDAMKQERQPQNFDYNQQNFKPNGMNGFHHQEYMQRNQMMAPNGTMPNGFEAPGMQQALLRQNQQELARQMTALMRTRPPPSQLNVDVSFLHDNSPFGVGVNALLGTAAPPVLPSPMLDLPLLAPFYAMRNMRAAATSSGILHARLDACYEQWRQLERERKRTEARLALAYPGRAVSSSNSIPVPRLPPCPTRVDRLTVDMLREHTKVLTLMGKMETLRASVCVANNKKPNKEDAKITVLRRGQENVEKEKDGVDPTTFDPTTWKNDVKNLAEIAPHSEVESAMLAWRNAVAGVQAARRRELAPHNARSPRSDPIIQLADAVKQLCVCARRARCAMWCDLTLTVALAPHPSGQPEKMPESTSQTTSKSTDNVTKPSTNTGNKQSSDAKEEKSSTETKKDPKPDPKQATTKQPDKPPEKINNQQLRRNQNYRKTQPGRNDFYKRYDNRFMHNRHPYHYLATGPIN